MNKEKLPDSLALRKEMLIQYFSALKEGYQSHDWEDSQVLRRFKALSRYLFDDFDTTLKLKSTFLRTKELYEFEQKLIAL